MLKVSKLETYSIYMYYTYQWSFFYRDLKIMLSVRRKIICLTVTQLTILYNLGEEFKGIVSKSNQEKKQLQIYWKNMQKFREKILDNRYYQNIFNTFFFFVKKLRIFLTPPHFFLFFFFGHFP